MNQKKIFQEYKRDLLIIMTCACLVIACVWFLVIVYSHINISKETLYGITKKAPKEYIKLNIEGVHFGDTPAMVIKTLGEPTKKFYYDEYSADSKNPESTLSGYSYALKSPIWSANYSDPKVESKHYPLLNVYFEAGKVVGIKYWPAIYHKSDVALGTIKNNRDNKIAYEQYKEKAQTIFPACKERHWRDKYDKSKVTAFRCYNRKNNEAMEIRIAPQDKYYNGDFTFMFFGPIDYINKLPKNFAS